MLNMIMELFDKNSKEYVICKICGTKGSHLTTHLNRKHNISTKEYQQLFPEAFTLSENYILKLKKKRGAYKTFQKHTCVICQQEFLNKSPNGSYCSKECYNKNSETKKLENVIKTSKNKYKNPYKYAECKICTKRAPDLTFHLKDKHSLLPIEYENIYNTPVFSDEILNRKKYLEYSTINELTQFYIENKRKFTNLFKSSKKFRENCELILSKEKLILYKNKIGHILFDYNNPDDKEKMCKQCNENKVIFNNFDKGYSKYCSHKCSTQDYDRIPEDSKRILILNRAKTKKEKEKDPLYKELISKKLSIANRNRDPSINLKQSLTMKRKILNGEFTPKSNNRNTHWKINIENKKFRSRYEALFWIYTKEIQNNAILYESKRIEYFDSILSKHRIYITDFEDTNNKIIYEIKPKSLVESQNVIDKEKALIDWCKQNNYTYKIITETHLIEYLKELHNKDLFNKYPFLVELNSTYKWLKNV